MAVQHLFRRMSSNKIRHNLNFPLSNGIEERNKRALLLGAKGFHHSESEK